MICEWCHEETERPHLDRLSGCVSTLLKKIERLELERDNLENHTQILCSTCSDLAQGNARLADKIERLERELRELGARTASDLHRLDGALMEYGTDSGFDRIVENAYLEGVVDDD